MMRLRTLCCILILQAANGYAETFEEWFAKDQASFSAYREEVTRQYNQFVEQDRKAYAEFLREAGEQWGRDNVWLPEVKVWVQYEEDLTERSNVNFDDGEAQVEILLPAGEDPKSPEALEELAKAVETVVLSGTVDPVEMFRRRMFDAGKTPDTQAAPSPAQPSSTYIVVSGDSLWRVSRLFHVSWKELAKANKLPENSGLQIGQRLVIPANVPVPAERRPSKTPMLGGQVAMADGTMVTHDNAAQYAQQLVATQTPLVKTITGDDGNPRQAVNMRFKLVPEHLRIRAERYRPVVLQYSREQGLYPPLVFAIIHTESAFNPRARSGAPAYGLMQLVPSSGARDAYHYVFKQDRLLNDGYLYNPEQNIELGTAYLYVLCERYLGSITHVKSRVYCAIAAYNTGAGNVSRCFGAGTSVKRATPIINDMTPEEVYQKLRKDLPYEETRNYVQRVHDRMNLYRDWR